jgi:hypothetical protein
MNQKFAQLASFARNNSLTVHQVIQYEFSPTSLTTSLPAISAT